MSAHGKKAEIALPSLIIADDEWARLMEKSGLRAKWAGPCEAMQGIFKRLKTEYGEVVAFVQAQTDFVEALKNYRDKSRPTFFLFFGGTLVKVITGANGPAIEKAIKEQIEIEKSGGAHKPVELEAGFEIIQPAPGRASVAEIIQADIKREIETLSQSKDLLSEQSKADNTSPTTSSEAFALIKPDGMLPSIIEAITEQIRSNRFHVVKTKKVWMSPENCSELFKESVGKPFSPSLVTYFTSGPCLAMVLSKENAVEDWKKLIGPSNSNFVKEADPKSLREFFGTENRVNAAYGSETLDDAKRDIESVFGAESKFLELPISEDEFSIKTSAGTQKTLCLIKSEDGVIRNAIIERIISRGIEIHRRNEVKLEQNQVLEMFSGVDDETAQILSRSSHLALVLMGENIVNIWKEMVGPEDPEIARKVAPQSIRALFGKDLIQNVIHASVSAEKALSEVMQVFPMVLERHGSVPLRDSRVGTATNPYPLEHHMSKKELHDALERTLGLIKPDAYSTGKKDMIMDRVTSEGFKIVKEAEVQLSLHQAQEFYKEHISKPFYDELIGWMSGTPIYAFVLERDGAVNAWRELIGPTNAVKAKEIAPKSIRALYGTDGSHNAVHGSDAPISAEREIKIVFGDMVSSSPDPLPLSPIEIAELEKKNKSDEMKSASRASLAQKEEVKSEKSVLNAELGNEPAVQPNPAPIALKSRPSSQRNSLSNLNKSTPKLSGSSNRIAEPKTPSSISKLGGSINKLAGSLSKLGGSASKLTGSKSKLV